MVARCVMQPTRAVCIREIQNSIKDSVKQLLADKIAALEVGALFEILESEIRGPNGSLIVFKGMQSYNADNIKSLEAYDIAWVEEAQTLSQHSLDLLRPTIRKEGSELWFSWNPRYKTDPVDILLRKTPPPGAVVVCVNWYDNPWFPDVLRTEMEHDFAVDEDKAEHIWHGAYGAGKGAILAKWVNKAEREGRVNETALFDPQGAPFEISSDLGFRDTASWWFWQRKLNGFTLFGYDGDSGLDAEDWCVRLGEKLAEWGVPLNRLGKIWLPTDAKAKTFASKHSAQERFWSAFGQGKIRIIPGSRKADQISAAREIIDRCEFHSVHCEAGLDGLRAWEFEYSDELGIFSREPLHNWASHPGDGFAYGSQMMMELPAPDEQPDIRMKGVTVGPPIGVVPMTFNEMVAKQRRKRMETE